MAEKVSTLVLKVDLECSKCYNKLRRTLCLYHHEIRSQTMDKKQGTVTITGPFDPQSFSKKLSSKAGKAIKGIEIKKKDEEKPKEKPAGGDAKPKEAEKPKEKPAGDAKPAEKPKDAKPAEKPKDAKPAEKPKEDKPADKPKEDKPKQAEGMKMVEPGPVLAYPMVQPYGVFPVYENYGAPDGGPVYDNYGRPLLYDNRVYGNGYTNGNYGYNNNNYGYSNNNGADYFSERNPTCTIM